MIGLPLFNYYIGSATRFVPFGLWSRPQFPLILFISLSSSTIFGIGLGLLFRILTLPLARGERLASPPPSELMISAPLARWVLVAIVLTLYLAFFGELIMAILPPPSGWPANFDAINCGIIALITVAAQSVLSNVSTRSKELVAHAALEAGRPFCLYLRSFKIDRSERFVHAARIWRVIKANVIPLYSIYAALFAKHPPGEDLQRLVARSAGSLPVLAVGDKVTKHGVAKMIATDEEWENLAEDLMRRAAVIVYSPYPTPGAIRELHIVTTRHLEKTIFVMPSAAAYFGINLRHNWDTMRDSLSTAIELPDYDPAGAIFKLLPGPNHTFRLGNIKPLNAATLHDALEDVSLAQPANL